MKGILYIHDVNIGEVIFSITDENMGVIGGYLIANNKYKKYQLTIQQHFDKKGICNIDDLNFCIVLEDNSKLRLEGGIGITDSANFDEIYVESAGLDIEIINKIKNAL